MYCFEIPLLRQNRDEPLKKNESSVENHADPAGSQHTNLSLFTMGSGRGVHLRPRDLQILFSTNTFNNEVTWSYPLANNAAFVRCLFQKPPVS